MDTGLWHQKAAVVCVLKSVISTNKSCVVPTLTFV